MSTKNRLPALSGYEPLITELKVTIRRAQVKAGLAVNRDLIILYWQIGRAILAQQHETGWDAHILDRLVAGLKVEFPDTEILSVRNLKYMREFAAAFRDFLIVQAGPVLLTWHHICILLDKSKDPDERHWYIQQATTYGWTTTDLTAAIEKKSYRLRDRGLADTNSHSPRPQSDLAQQMLSDTNTLEFLTLAPETHRKYVEKSGLSRLKEFLLQQQGSFAFVGSQYQILLQNNDDTPEDKIEDTFVDLLFYHLKLRRFFVVKLETQEYNSDYLIELANQLAGVDKAFRHETDGKTIGLLVCKSNHSSVFQYVVPASNNQLGLAQFDETSPIPEELKNFLPALEIIKRKFA